MRNRDAASLIAGISTPRALTKRIKYSVTENQGHRSNYIALGLDPDVIGYGLNDEWLDAVADQLELPRAKDLQSGGSVRPVAEDKTVPAGPPARPQVGPPARPPYRSPARPGPKLRPRVKATTEPAPTAFSLSQLSNEELFLGFVFCMAEAFSYGATGKWAYADDWGNTFALLGFAVVGFANGLLAVYNYCRINDQKRAEWWAVGLAVLAGCTHLATGFKVFQLSLILVSISLGLALFALASGIKKK